jgi:aminoglycoside 6'-N-acetyltransferase
MTLRFRPLTRDDFGQLRAWLLEPHVQPWWPPEHEPLDVEAEYGPTVDGREPTEIFVVELDGRPVGIIQRYLLESYPDYLAALAPAAVPPRSASIDYLIGDASLIGQGLGGRVIADFVRETWERYPAITHVVVSVQQANRRSWRALEKAGFHRLWSGTVDSGDPSDRGPAHVYALARPARHASPSH